jgi:hypothetical protein
MKALERRRRSILAVAVFLAVGLPKAVPGAPADEIKPKEASSDPFLCTEIIGVSATGEWYSAGFEDGIDGARWQVRSRKQAFVQLWADPANELWQIPVESPCAQRSDNPDRVIFTGVNWEYKTRAEWQEKLAAAVETIRKKHPGARRIELITMLRGPGNQTCGSHMTVVEPYVDEAVAAVAASAPELVFAGPKVVAETCDVFTKGGPHYTDAGRKEVARFYREQLRAR